MTQEQPFLEKLITRLKTDGFMENNDRATFVYERLHPMEPILKTTVSMNIVNGVYSYNLLTATVGTILNSKYRDYTISYPVNVRPYLGEDVYIDKIIEAARAAYQKGCVWYDNKNGTNTASGEVIVPKVGGYQKIDCPKTPLDDI